MNNLVIAWRNIWRNKKRTLITVAAVFIAVLLSTFMSSMQEGTYSKMIDNVVKFYSGYIQIHHPKFWDSKSINDIYQPNDTLYSILKSVPEVTLYVPRLESFSLLSTGENTRGAVLIGIDPEKENQLTGLSKWVIEGKYLNNPGDDGLLLAANLAEHLNVKIGDTLILLSQGYHGASAAALCPVRGIVKFPSPQLNDFAYLHIQKARDFFSAPGMVTSLAIMVDKYHHVESAKYHLVEQLGKNYSGMTWNEMQPEIQQMIEGDRAGGVIMKAILYIVIGFGIFGTIIMMVAERRRESGIMVAIGMRKFKLELIMLYETILIGLSGVITGFLFSIPFIAYFVYHPIPLPEKVAEAYETFGLEPAMYFSMMPRVFVNQAITVLVITMFIAIYPVFKIAKLELVKALRG